MRRQAFLSIFWAVIIYHQCLSNVTCGVFLCLSRRKLFSLFFFKVVESILNLCVELRQVTPKLKCSKPLFWKAQVVPIKSVRRTFSFQNLACSSGNVRCAHLNNVTSHKETSDEHHIQLLEVRQKKVQEVPPPQNLLLIIHMSYFIYGCLLNVI